MDSTKVRAWLEWRERIRIWWIQGPATHVRSVREDSEFEEIAEHLTSITPEVDNRISRAAHRAGFRATIAGSFRNLVVVKL